MVTEDINQSTVGRILGVKIRLTDEKQGAKWLK
jgi:hypothetical protein